MENKIKIAITGSEGFLGQELVSKLSKSNITITTLNRKKHYLLKPETLKEFVNNKDCVVHLAAYHGNGPIKHFKQNSLATLSLLEAITLYGSSPHVIFSSSAQMYLKKGMFGYSKKTAEDLIRIYALENKITATVLRISNIYGPGGKPDYNSVIATIVDRVNNNKAIYINGDGSQKRDFIYVSDVADAIVQSIKYPSHSYQVLDICTGKLTSLNNVLSILRTITEKPVDATYDKKKTSSASYPKKSPINAQKSLHWRAKTTFSKGLSAMIGGKK